MINSMGNGSRSINFAIIKSSTDEPIKLDEIKLEPRGNPSETIYIQFVLVSSTAMFVCEDLSKEILVN